ncbi:MAG: transglycosylase SLT domain-containing protein, partial [Acidobacteriota bacterium]
TDEYDDTDDDSPIKDTRPSPTPKGLSTDVPSTPGGTTVPVTESPQGSDSAPPADILKGRKYLQLSDSEKRQYLSEKALRIAQIIGNNSSDAIPPAALDKIKGFTEGFAKRTASKGMNGCPSKRPWGDNLQATYDRASKNAPFIVKAFNEKGVDPRIGLYLAMIESEHCVCLQSDTGPLGMFQFTKATGEMHGLKTVKGATPENPDERCEPEPAARAAASYMKALTGRYGT